MEALVHGAFALFKGLDDEERFERVDVNELQATLVAVLSTRILTQPRHWRHRPRPLDST